MSATMRTSASLIPCRFSQLAIWAIQAPHAIANGTLTQAQAETLAIVAYLQPVSRPEIARIRGVSSESAVATLTVA